MQTCLLRCVGIIFAIIRITFSTIFIELDFIHKTYSLKTKTTKNDYEKTFSIYAQKCCLLFVPILSKLLFHIHIDHNLQACIANEATKGYF